MLSELLQQLAPYEPAITPFGSSGMWLISCPDGSTAIVDPTEPDQDSLARLEYWLRERIETRAWDWLLSKESDQYAAELFDFERFTPHKGRHEQPAIALLQAYLSAVGEDV